MARDSLSDDEVSNTEGVKVICVGVMRTGLKTLHRALRNLGYSNIYDQEDIVSTFEHWDQVLHNGAASEVAFAKIFDGVEVAMGMPTFCFWEQIAQMYPNARVILTVRNEDDWWQSVRYAESLMHKDLPGAPLRHGSLMRCFERFLMPSYHRYCQVLRFAWATTLGARALESGDLNESVARSSYRKHNSYVKETLGKGLTAEGNPRLLVYNVHDGWEPLCEFLGRDLPEVEFPSVMEVPYFPGQQAKGDTGRRSFEEMLLPDGDFGIQMRKELRCGLAQGAALLTLVVAAVLAIIMTKAMEVPLAVVAIGYIAIMVIVWNVYVVMHSLVLKVPALVVLPMAMQGLLIAGALQACFISYGILKEMLVTQDHIASPVLVLSSRFGAIVCAAIFMLLSEGRITLGAPIHSMLAFAFTNEASTWAGYEMLKYVSFPVQVMAKSVKMLPSMLMGRLLNGNRYSTYQYLQAVAALVCVAIMNFTDSGTGGGKKGKGGSDAEDMSAMYKLGMGVAMLMVFFACDSFTSQWQDKLYQQYPGLTQTQMMLGGNLLGFLLTSGTLVAAWPKVQESIAVAVARPEVMGRIICLGFVYALGQFCIYSAIRILGPLSFTWIMTARQLLSVLISLVFFGHGVSVTKVVCILVVFGIMSAKQLTKAMPKIAQGAQQLREAISRRALEASSPFSGLSPAITKGGSLSFSDVVAVTATTKKDA